jgi:hypothetical protein
LDLKDLPIGNISGEPLGVPSWVPDRKKKRLDAASLEPEVKAFGPPGSPRSSRYWFEIPQLVAEDGST